jgi:hypothetical protein
MNRLENAVRVLNRKRDSRRDFRLERFQEARKPDSRRRSGAELSPEEARKAVKPADAQIAAATGREQTPSPA